MSTDPTAKPDRPAPLPTASPAPTPAVAPAPGVAPAPRISRREQVRFWQSFFLGMTSPGELPVYHHSNLFYWWPVWLLGFVFAAVTYVADTHMAIVPPGTVAAEARNVEIGDEKRAEETRDVLILGKDRKHVRRKGPDGELKIIQPTIYMTQYKWMGTLFVIVLLIVIVITNIALRGLWSVLVLVLLISLAIIFAVAGWWDTIMARLGQLAIYINLGGYIALSSILFVVWFLNFFIMDRQTYMIFTPGQVRVRLEIGGGEIVYDTAGMVFFKQRSDMFRHWVLGFGSGDLIVRPAGLGHALEMPNVLGVGRKVKQIEAMMKEKLVVAGPNAI